GLRDVAQRFHVPREIAVAAVHRAAKRSGYTMRVFIEQLEQQIATEKRAVPGGPTAPPSGATGPGPGAPKSGR
ncbi:MAG: hypothetical protein HY330_06820, partial [Chloroflexi bacterium]|nr:hypothetical protein [Chloroflexota bacterium]